ncbi:MAG: hypothetical protein GY708_22160 [Actinomycetia bacterium]|nr:hypothetical protein [Actinomycetes bacterium]
MDELSLDTIARVLEEQGGIFATIEDLESVAIAPEELVGLISGGAPGSDRVFAVLLWLAARCIDVATDTSGLRDVFVSGVERLLVSPDPDVVSAGFRVVGQAQLSDCRAAVGRLVEENATSADLVRHGLLALSFGSGDERSDLPEVVRAVLAADPVASVREDAAFVLGCLGDEGEGAGDETLRVLKILAEDDDEETARYARIGLCRYGDSTYWSEVLDSLRVEYESVEIPVLEAAAVLGLPQFCKPLKVLSDQKLTSKSEAPEMELVEWTLDAARAACCDQVDYREYLDALFAGT